MNFNFDQKIALLGLGVENMPLLKWLIEHGAKNITVCDKNTNLENKISELGFQDLKLQLGENYLENLDKFDVVFRTPGIPYLNQNIQNAINKGVKISSPIKLFFDLCPCKIIGVTGTKGKGTTSTIIYNIFKKGYRYSAVSDHQGNEPVIHLAGNIGKSPIQFLDQLKINDLVVLELSSFQLQDLEKSPHIAVVLNVTCDHLDYHKNVNEYIEAKKNITKYQGPDDFSVINFDYETSKRFSNGVSQTCYFSVKSNLKDGTYVDWENHCIIWKKDDCLEKIINLSDIKIVGAHNLENICAAITVGKTLGVNNACIKDAIVEFKGLEFRIEHVIDLENIGYYNDSASTNPDTTVAAMKSFNRPIILIAGGSSKGVSFEKIGKEIANTKVKEVILMGQTSKEIGVEIEKYSTIKPKYVSNLTDAVNFAKGLAKSGDVVLFSPASASFDMFKDYKDRGNQFNQLIKTL